MDPAFVRMLIPAISRMMRFRPPSVRLRMGKRVAGSLAADDEDEGSSDRVA